MVFSIELSFFCLLCFITGKTDKCEQMVFIHVMVFGLGGLYYSSEYKNKYIEFSEKYVHFNSFRFKKEIKPLSFNVKYEDVLSIDARNIPFIGNWAVTIRTKTFPKPIVVSFFFKKHKEIYNELISKAKYANPNIYISSQLNKYQ